MKEKIAIGLSGGVDSAVAAYLLKQEGYEVIGLTMETGGPSVEKDAKEVAEHLGIHHEMIDVRECFEREVKEYFVEEYRHGRTPNPCVMCNPAIKWKALMNAAKERGISLFATGHYANIIPLENGRCTVKMCDFAAKDQTYVLYQLSQEQLKNTIMPLGKYDKTQIREIAEQIGLSVADKPDSMEICFIPDNDYCRFIHEYCEEKGKTVPPVGDFIAPDGTVLGKHAGIHHYTIGQRKGLGIALGKPAFVTKIDADTNTVVLGDNDDIFTKEVIADQVNWVGLMPLEEGEQKKVTARIRYNHRGAEAILQTLADGKIQCTFTEPQRAVTPGQSLVVYIDGYVAVGGRIIC